MSGLTRTSGLIRTIELRRVAVTGVGVVSPIGIGKEPFLEALLAGRSGIVHVSRFDTTEYPVKIAGEVRGFEASDFIDRKMAKRLDRYAQYGVAAATLALQDSGYPVSEDPYEVGALIGSGVGGLDTFFEQTGVLLEKGPTRLSPFFIPMMIPNMASAMSSVALGLKGPVNATCTACAAGTNALGDAFSSSAAGMRPPCWPEGPRRPSTRWAWGPSPPCAPFPRATTSPRRRAGPSMPVVTAS